jgi:hypothetical protein
MCFDVSGQCFSSVRPTGEGGPGDCVIIIQVENAYLFELAGDVYGFCQGQWRSNLAWLSSNPPSATWRRRGRLMWAIFLGQEPGRLWQRHLAGWWISLIIRGLDDKATARGLREIELWLTEVDKRRLSLLPWSYDFFSLTFLYTTSDNNTSNCTQFVHLTSLLVQLGFRESGWENMPRSLLMEIGELTDRWCHLLCDFNFDEFRKKPVLPPPPRVCAILLWLYTSTEHLKRVYTSKGPLLEIDYFT